MPALAATAVELPGRDRARIYVASAPLTNSQFLELMREARLSNGPRGHYLLVNEYNPFLAIHRDAQSNELSVRAGFEDHPVCGVCWRGAMLVAAAAGARLPTEAEWEWFAAAGDRTRRYPWGDAAPEPGLANFGEHVGGTTPVGEYPPNPWGMVDLAGNAGEWCQDPWPRDQRPGTLTARVIKGGSWNKPEELLAIPSRRVKWGGIGTVGIGVRLVWDGPSTAREGIA